MKTAYSSVVTVRACDCVSLSGIVYDCVWMHNTEGTRVYIQSSIDRHGLRLATRGIARNTSGGWTVEFVLPTGITDSRIGRFASDVQGHWEIASVGTGTTVRVSVPVRTGRCTACKQVRVRRWTIGYVVTVLALVLIGRVLDGGAGFPCARCAMAWSRVTGKGWVSNPIDIDGHGSQRVQVPYDVSSRPAADSVGSGPWVPDGAFVDVARAK